MRDNNEIKRLFRNTFRSFLDENISFKFLLLDIFVDGTAYLVGGYFRDMLLKRKSRDLDIIVDLPHNILLEKIMISGVNYEINRHKGIKILLGHIEIDMWSLENNWAFREKLVKLNQDDKLSSIVKGCFYNYDALAINLHTFNFNIQYFNEFINSGTLDILQEKAIYKKLNPTTEANILRAFYIQKVTGAKFSDNTKQYLLRKIGELNDTFKSSDSRLSELKKKYPKYDNSLRELDIFIMSNEITKGIVHKRQFYLDI